MKINKKIFYIVGVFFVLGIALLLSAKILLFSKINSNNLKSESYFYIKSNSSLTEVVQQSIYQNILSDTTKLKLVFRILRYNKVKAGRYKIKKDMNFFEFVKLLKSGNQSPLNVTFNSIRFKSKLVELAASKLEIDSVELDSLLSDSLFLSNLGYNKDNVTVLFIPNTYEFFWTTSAVKFIQRFDREHEIFWNNARLLKAKKIGLSTIEVSILASIVQEETNKSDEMSRIAGVYLNRLKKNMLLQADPTARFAYGDFAVKRINFNYIKFDSPYNTYVYEGLPPGPICFPNSKTIDKVLNAESHNFLFFCAKPDFSGYHNFAKTDLEHSRNAQAYHRFLNKNKIH